MTNQLTHEDIKTEMTRRKTKRASLLGEFQRQGYLTTGQILRIAGTGMSSRLKELQKEGYIILRAYDKPGQWIYTYLGHRDDNDDGTNVNEVD